VRRAAPGLRAGAAIAVVAVVVGLLLLARAGSSGANPSAASLLSFGYNYYGELGSVTNNRSSDPNPTPTVVTLPGADGSVSHVAAGDDFSLAVTSSGQLYAFGDNEYGQLGSAANNVGNTPNPTPTLVTLPGENGTVTDVAAGYDHSLAVTSSGQLYAFGDNDHGQLGNATNNGSSAANPTPTLVTLPNGSGTATQVAAGDDTSLVVTSTGALFSFGDNDYGQLGFGTNSGTNNPDPTPTQVQLPGGSGAVTAVAAGGDFSLVATASGQLYAFGNNYYGQLGTTASDGSNTANPAPSAVTLPGESGTVTQVAAGTGSSLVVTSGGQLYSFGDNYEGQLGNTTNNGSGSPNPTATLVALPAQSGTVTTASAGDDYSLAVTSSGQLYAFGDGADGQLGSATVTGFDNPTPTVVSLPTGVTATQVAAGGGQSLMISGGSGGAAGSGTVKLTITTSGAGTGFISGSSACFKSSAASSTCSATFPLGTVITLHGSPTGSSSFVGWLSLTPGGCTTPGDCTITMTNDQSVTAYFQPTETLTTTVDGTGQGYVQTSDYSEILHRGLRCTKAPAVSSTTCARGYRYGAEVTLTAFPTGGTGVLTAGQKEQSKFVGWSGACAGTGTCTVSMDDAENVTASFSYDAGVHVNAMEITQAIQTTELPTRDSASDTQVFYHGVPLASTGGAITTVKLAQDHATVVRVYVNTELPLDGQPVPAMRLYAFRDGRMLAPGPIGPDAVPSARGFPVGEVATVTAKQHYGNEGVYTFTLPWGWAEGTVNFTADTNPDPTEFFHNCDTIVCRDRGLTLNQIHFNPVTVANVEPVAITVQTYRPLLKANVTVGPVGWSQTDPQVDPAWSTVQELVPFPVDVPSQYVDVVDGTSAVEGCDGVSKTAKSYANQVYAARNAALRNLVSNWATGQGGDASSSVYPYGLLQPTTQSQCAGVNGYSGGNTNGGGGSGGELYGSIQPLSVSSDDRPITGIAHEFYHGIGLAHAGEQCGSGTLGTAETLTGSTTSGSKILTLAAPETGLVLGQPISGPGLPSEQIVAIGGTTITMFAPATSTNSNASYTFATSALVPSQTGSAWAPTFLSSNGLIGDGLLDGVGLVGLDHPGSAYTIRGPAVAGKKGSEFYDLMSYCTGVSDALAWISVRNWNYAVGFDAPVAASTRDRAAVRTTRSSGAHAPSGNATAYSTNPPSSAGNTRSLAIASYYDVGSATTVFSNVTPDAGAPTPTGATDTDTYTLTARNAAGHVVASAGASATLLHMDPSVGHPAESMIQIEGKVPAAGVREIDVLQDGTRIAQDRASAHTPTVRLLSPSPGATVGGPAGAVIRWRAHDADGGDLQVTIRYSADRGHSWKTVYSGPNNGSAVLPSYLLSASRDARVRLYVSDGFNEAILTSPRFRALGAPPTVNLTAPTRAIRVSGDASVNLAGTAEDDSGVMLTGRALVWRSGRQLLGRGTRITTTALSVGHHRVTLTARDPAGRVASASVAITILASPPVLTVLRVPKRVSRKARYLTLRVATLAPARLAVGRARASVDRRSKLIHVRISPKVRTLLLVLRSGRYRVRVPITFRR
jgi:alpha-tubulin suppressor-like RCC1 family protein